MADLSFSRQPVYLADASNNIADVVNTAPTTQYGIVVRNIPSGTQTVDSELPAAAALTDNTANPTVPGVGGFLMLWDGATWDRAAGNSADGQLVNLGANNDVTVTSGSVTADTELPAAAALADATGNPTVPGVGGFLMGYNGTSWDRVRTANTGRLQVDVVTGGGSNASVLVDNAAFTDTTSSVTAIGGYFDEVAGTALTENDIAAIRIDSKRAQIGVIEDATTRGQRLAISAAGALSANVTHVGGTALALGQTTMSASLPVTMASNQSAISVDTELPTAAALADNTANPTVPGVGAFLMGYDGTTWDRVGLSATGGRLQVDVISGGGSPAPSEVPSGYNALVVYGTTSATASSATATVTTNTPASTKVFYVRSVFVAASGATKWQVKFGASVLATGFIPQAQLSDIIRFDPPISGTGDGTTALTVDVTNREASAMDLYARMGAIVQQ